ncbi:MAG: sensor histidine kinase [Candidatus Micrarchaeaceae archaeon]
MTKVTFKADLNLLLELGEELISKDEIAVSELVKNSYDADARIVEVAIDDDSITISDNGNGMTMDVVQNSWLVIGTSFKRRNTISPGGRRVLGEKGIGRLSAFRLGSSLEVRTHSEGEDLIELRMNIPERSSVNGPDSRINLMEAFTAELSVKPPERIFPDNSTSGTILKISKLRGIWNEDKIEKLKMLLSRLIHPLDTSISNFSISLFVKGVKRDLEAPEALKMPHYSIDVSLSEEGHYNGEVKYRDEKNEPVIQQISGIITVSDSNKREVHMPPVSEGGPGPLRFRLLAWDRDSPDLRGWKKELDYYSGMSLIRDNFLVVQPKIDWLELNIRRVQNPTMRLSTNQIIGTIYISSDANRNLIDKTDREGLIENDALQYLKEAIHYLMGQLETIRYEVRKRRRLAKGAVLDLIDSRPLREIAARWPEEYKNPILDIADDLDRSRAEIEELILGRDRMATIGLLAAELVHSGRNALVSITDSYPYIESHLSEVPESIREKIQNMVESGKIIEAMFRDLNPFLKFRTRTQTEIDLSEMVKMLSRFYQGELRRYNIQLVQDIEENLNFVANQTDILILLTNFIVNSIYWVTRGNLTETQPKIKISAWEEGENVIIEVEDTGPGIPEEYKDLVFELGVSYKIPPGTGIGLTVNRDIVNHYGGKIELTCNSDMGGAKFRVTLPRREG